MSKLVILITSRVEEGHRIGEAWQQAGAPGVTFVESYGLRRLQQAARNAEVLPGMVSLLEILRQDEETSLIVLCVVDDDTLVNKLLAATEAVLGSLMEPNTGVAFVLDVERTIGVRDHSTGQRAE
ncbi:MAG: hypothetical protein HXY40_12295 [Chloroflexi bacterium]|nr:hypothetical protein [Chloroflexota bacterium]